MKDLNVRVKDGALEEILTQEEAANYLKVSKNTLIEWGKSGVVNPIKVVGRVYYKVKDIRALFTSNEGGVK
jgi:excisionase family DNA binding protein